MLFQSLRTRFFAHRLNKSVREQEPGKFARLVQKGLKEPVWQGLITPSVIAAGARMMAENVDHDEKASDAFIHLIRAVAPQPELLQEVDDEAIEELLTDVIADDKLGPLLAATLNIFAPTRPVTVANTLTRGISLLMDADETPNEQIAEVILATARSPLCQRNEMFAQALHHGVASGTYLLAQGGYTQTAVDIFAALEKNNPDAGSRASLKQAMVTGMRTGLIADLTESPFVYLENITPLMDDASPLLDAVTDKDVCHLAVAVLRNRDVPEERCELPNVLLRLKEVPRFAFALNTMPELKRMVIYTTEEMGTGYPMVVEARPQGDFTVTTGCRVDEPPYKRIEAWLDHTNSSRRESGIPRVFEAIASLTDCPYPRQALAAKQELAALGQLYLEHWQYEARTPFSAKADSRIRAAIAQVPVPARPDLP